jgi:hypothetical protein
VAQKRRIIEHPPEGRVCDLLSAFHRDWVVFGSLRRDVREATRFHDSDFRRVQRWLSNLRCTRLEKRLAVQTDELTGWRDAPAPPDAGRRKLPGIPFHEHRRTDILTERLPSLSITIEISTGPWTRAALAMAGYTGSTWVAKCFVGAERPLVRHADFSV